MQSYLSNRHYHLLTKELPEELRVNQPKMAYMYAYNQHKVEIPAQHNKKTSKFKVKHTKVHNHFSNFGDCCPICFSSDNIEVEYYGKKHVCVKCRKLMRDQFGNQIKIFMNEIGDIVCLGIKVSENREVKEHVYYYTDYTKLEISGRSAFATYAKAQQMVVLLREQKPSDPFSK